MELNANEVPSQTQPGPSGNYKVGCYRKIRGKLLILDGFFYTRNKTRGNYSYLCCAKKKEGCPGTAKLHIESNTLEHVRSHNHEQGQYDAQVFELKIKARRAAQASENRNKSTRTIFNETTRGQEQASRITYRPDLYSFCLFSRTCVPNNNCIDDCKIRGTIYCLVSKDKG